MDWNPDEQLSVILRDDIIEDSPTATLDSMYTQVLAQSVFKHRQGRQEARLSGRFKTIVGLIVLLSDVLPAQGLSALLQISKDEIDLALSSLHSVLNVPKNSLDPIQLLHPFFRDFLLNAERKLEQFSTVIQSITFSADGQWLASASFDSTVQLWDSKTGASLQTLKGHSGMVRSITFSPARNFRRRRLFDSLCHLSRPNAAKAMQRAR